MAYLVAVGTTDGVNVDEHFGSATTFLVVSVDERTGAFTPVERRDVPEPPAMWGRNVAAPFMAPQGHSAHGVQHAVVADMLRDCDYVLVQRIGPHAQDIVRAKHLTPVMDAGTVADAVARLNASRAQEA